ncbi:MAG: DUF58 domain-containing protein [Candidatus Dormibacteria bacterium]
MAVAAVPSTTRGSTVAEPGAIALALRRAGLTMVGAGLLIAAVLVWLLAHATGAKTVYLLAYVLALLVAGAYVVARRRRRLVAERSKLPNRARVGQAMDVEVTLSSPSRLTGFMVEETLHPHLGATVRLPVNRVAPGADAVLSYSFRPQLRGVYEIGPLTAEWTDPFSIARRDQVLAEPVRLIVHPATESAIDRPLTRLWEDPPLRPPVSKPWPVGMEFYGMREYVAGDDLRRVVWKAVARTGRMLVRESEQGITDRMVIVLDTDREWHSPGNPSDTFELAVRAAASAGAYHLREGFSVSLHSNEDVLGTSLRGPQARLRLLDALAAVQPGRSGLDQALERLLRGSRCDAHTLVITSHLSDKHAARLGLLINSGASVLVVVLAWEDGDPLTVRRAHEIGAQVAEVKPGASLARVFAHAVGAGVVRA